MSARLPSRTYEPDWTRSLIALVVTLSIAQVDLLVGRSLQGSSRLSVLDLTQPAGYTAVKVDDRNPVDRKDVSDLLRRLTDPRAFMNLPAQRQQVLAENIVQVNHLAHEVMWHTYRLLEVLDDKALEPYHKIFNDPTAMNATYRSDWVWISEQITGKLRIPTSFRPTDHPKSWDPTKDKAFESWYRITSPYSHHFVHDITLEAQTKVLLVSLIAITPQQQRALGEKKLAVLQAESKQLCDSANRLQSYWHLFESWIIEDANSGHVRQPHPPNDDLDFAELAHEFEEAEQRLRSPEKAARPASEARR